MRALLLLFALVLANCMNRVEVPDQVEVTTKDVTVKHVITLELPTIFTDTCKKEFPDNIEAYNECISNYINDLLTLINGLQPANLPEVPNDLPGQ